MTQNNQKYDAQYAASNACYEFPPFFNKIGFLFDVQNAHRQKFAKSMRKNPMERKKIWKLSMLAEFIRGEKGKYNQRLRET